MPAQTNRGAIAGTVFDEAAAVLPGATVTVLAVGTNIERHTTTSVTGVYAVTHLEPVVTAWCRRRRAGVEVAAGGYGLLPRPQTLACLAAY